MAIRAAAERASESGMTRSVAALLQAILSCVSVADPFAPVFARKETLAKMADISEASVYRGLTVLAEAEWIVREETRPRLDDGTVCISEIAITDKCAMLVGLIESVDGNSGKQPSTTDNPKELQDTVDAPITDGPAPIATPLINVSGAPKTDAENVPTISLAVSADAIDQGDLRDGLRDGSIYRVGSLVYPKASVDNQSTQRYVRMDGRSVPVELAWTITEKKLRYGQLFKLMKLAKQVQGQTLTDFIELRKDRIRQLITTNDCYRYLKNLIDQGLDAKFLNGQVRKAEHRVARKAQCKEAEEKRSRWIRHHDGKQYQDMTTGRIYSVSAIGSHAYACDGEGNLTNTSYKITGRFIKLVEEGRLQPFVRPVVIVDAEKVVERAGSLLQMLRKGRFGVA